MSTQVAATDRPIAYLEGDTAVYRASAVGSCSKALIAARLGYTPLSPPDSQQVVFDEGHLHEGAVIQRLNANGWAVYSEQQEVEIQVSSRVVIRGHIDGIGKPDRLRVFDVKSMSEDAFKAWVSKRWDGLGYFAKYADQMTVYMEALALPGALVAKNRNNGAMDLFFFDDPPSDIRAIKARVLKAEAAARKGELPVGCDLPMFPCSFFYLHEEKEEVEVAEDQVLDALAETYAHGAELESQGKAIKSEVRPKLLECLGDRDKANTGRFQVARSLQHRKGIDTKALARDLPDVAAQYETTTPVEQVRVKEVAG